VSNKPADNTNVNTAASSAAKGLALLKKSSEAFFVIGLNKLPTQELRDQAILEFLGKHATASVTQEGAIVLGKRLNLDEYNEIVGYIAETQELSIEAAKSMVKSSAQEKGLANIRANRVASGGLRRGKLAMA